MNNILYLTNKEIPYKIKYFNEIAKNNNLTVYFDQKNNGDRNQKWSKSIKNDFKLYYADSNDFNYSKFFSQLKNYDFIIIGSYNCNLSLKTINYLKKNHMKYIIDIDGDYFIDKISIKNFLKKRILRGAECYIIAGDKTIKKYKRILKTNSVYPYYFSPFFKKEIIENNLKSKENKGEYILLVSRYLKEKGTDIALYIAKKIKDKKIKIVGVGNKALELKKEIEKQKITNIEIIPFLQKEELNNVYSNAKVLILPSRKECWGLVINEAASFGLPIVSTYGSGAAVEFLEGKYSKYLAKKNSKQDFYIKLKNFLKDDEKKEYKEYLLYKSREYNIERSVKVLEEILKKEKEDEKKF